MNWSPSARRPRSSRAVPVSVGLYASRAPHPASAGLTRQHARIESRPSRRGRPPAIVGEHQWIDLHQVASQSQVHRVQAHQRRADRGLFRLGQVGARKAARAPPALPDRSGCRSATRMHQLRRAGVDLFDVHAALDREEHERALGRRVVEDRRVELATDVGRASSTISSTTSKPPTCVPSRSLGESGGLRWRAHESHRAGLAALARRYLGLAHDPAPPSQAAASPAASGVDTPTTPCGTRSPALARRNLPWCSRRFTCPHRP